MLKVVAAVLIAMLVPTAVFAKEKPLPEGIKIISEQLASNCQFIDVVSAMRFAMTSAKKTNRKALIAALEDGLGKGGNAAVITSLSVSNNQHQYVLSIYQCPEDSNK